MKFTWIGQAGLIIDNGQIKIMVDPYLSDSVAKANPRNYRRYPANEDLFSVEPDIMIYTHDHLDHYDPETAEIFLGGGRKPMTVLSPVSVWQKAKLHNRKHNYVCFDRGCEWTEGGVRVRAVKAAHSDPCAIGVLITDLGDGRVYYITGDTLYNTDIFADLDVEIDTVFLPVNGVGNNMNATDAARFSKKCGARRAVPYHVGLFDSLTPEIFDDENRLILKLYEETEL